jgi:hypothetical protein
MPSISQHKPGDRVLIEVVLVEMRGEWAVVRIEHETHATVLAERLYPAHQETLPRPSTQP